MRKTYFFLFFLFFSIRGFSQDSIQTVNKRYAKIAYIDHSRIRSEYFAFKAFKDSVLSVAKSADENYQKAVKVQDSLYNGQAGSSASKEMEETISKQKQQMLADFQESQKTLNQKRISAMQAYERKIALAIREVIAKNGFTDVRPIPKDGSNFQGTDITDLVIRSLNLTR